MSGIKHIVFDLGNVLVRWDPEIPYRRLIPDAAARRRFLDEVCNSAWLAKTDAGATWAEAEAELIVAHPADAAMIREFRRHHAEMLPGPIEESTAIANRLIDAGYDVTALTNWAADTFLEAEQRFPVFRRFRGVTVSARIGTVKPDAAIFRHHAETFGLQPAATLFFDDSPRNVAAARAAGWNAEVFVDPDGLRRDLARHGIPLK
ncbi:MAG TPA: HAD family phosphatase [Bauldia sp.]|nr:HAD family phosphatase [Bauldia sp.]